MRRTGIVLVFLGSAILSACSGEGPSGSMNLPPAVPPLPPPATPRFTPPFPALPLPAIQSLACSPCKRIAFVSMRDGNQEIFSINPDGTDLKRLTTNDSYDDDPSWSPDGQQIAFVSGRNGINDVYVMSADGSNVERRTFLQNDASDPAWSPNGAQIAFRTNSEGSSNIWMVPATGGTAVLLFLTPGNEGEPAWAPDGSRLTLQSDWFAYDAVSDIFVIDRVGAGFTALTDGNILDGLDYYFPSWSPDGQRIALVVRHDLSSDGSFVNWLAVMNVDGSGLTLLHSPPWLASANLSYPTEYFYNPSWSPDGTTIAYTHFIYEDPFISGHYEVSWIRADGSARGTITNNGWNPDWQR